MSEKTHYFSAFIVILSVFFSLSSSIAGTLGTKSEIERLQSEVAEARNSLDKALLEKGAKADDPKIKAKAATLDEKMKAFRKAFQDSQTPSKSAKKHFTGETRENAPAPTTAVKSEPETVLSAEGIPGEITYQKKKGINTKGATTEPSPEASATPSVSAISEIQYIKKKPK